MAFLWELEEWPFYLENVDLPCMLDELELHNSSSMHPSSMRASAERAGPANSPPSISVLMEEARALIREVDVHSKTHNFASEVAANIDGSRTSCTSSNGAAASASAPAVASGALSATGALLLRMQAFFDRLSTVAVAASSAAVPAADTSTMGLTVAAPSTGAAAGACAPLPQPVSAPSADAALPQRLPSPSSSLPPELHLLHKRLRDASLAFERNLRPVNMNLMSRPKGRYYIHSRSSEVIHEDSDDVDTDDEQDTRLTSQERRRQIDASHKKGDLSKHEKRFYELWNNFMDVGIVYARKATPAACLEFAQLHASTLCRGGDGAHEEVVLHGLSRIPSDAGAEFERTITQKKHMRDEGGGMRRCFLLFLESLRDRSMISLQDMMACLKVVDGHGAAAADGRSPGGVGAAGHADGHAPSAAASVSAPPEVTTPAIDVAVGGAAASKPSEAAASAQPASLANVARASTAGGSTSNAATAKGSAAARVAAPPAPPPSWSCEQCTYDNDAESVKCGVCNYRRTKRAAARAAAAAVSSRGHA